MAAGIRSAFLTHLVGEAVKREASDIILSFGCHPTLKVDDKLQILSSLGVLKDSDLSELADQIMPKAKLAVLEEQRQVDLAYSDGPHRFRVNIFYQRGHPSIVMRYIRESIRTLEELGLPGQTKELIQNDNGLILMVGPTGSGKSTTMAGMVDHINQTEAKHILTIEDPIEYLYTNQQSIIEQREIGIDAVDFAAALRAALREAPDVILLGEMRDLESISTAITVAETGHLILSTVHANSAVGCIDRIVDIFPAEAKDQIRIQLADILLAVYNQRLVPLADGSGSTLIVETMMATSAVRNAIRTNNNAELPTIIQTSARDGMYLLDDLLIKAAERGEISKESALAYANDRSQVRKGLGLRSD